MHLEDCMLVVKEENECGVTLELSNSSQHSTKTGNFTSSTKLIVSTLSFVPKARGSNPSGEIIFPLSF